jgi:hypothetical protein
MTLDPIQICDLNLGNKSVTNDIENVLRKIEAWHRGSIAGFPNHVWDPDGYVLRLMQWDSTTSATTPSW